MAWLNLIMNQIAAARFVYYFDCVLLQCLPLMIVLVEEVVVTSLLS